MSCIRWVRLGQTSMIPISNVKLFASSWNFILNLRVPGGWWPICWDGDQYVIIGRLCVNNMVMKQTTIRFYIIWHPHDTWLPSTLQMESDQGFAVEEWYGLDKVRLGQFGSWNFGVCWFFWYQKQWFYLSKIVQHMHLVTSSLA